MTFTLRPYQRESLDALYAYWADGRGNPLIVLPTGCGKTLVLAALCQELLRDYPTLRIAVVTHVRELIQQNFLELMRLWPSAPAGIYSAGIGRRDARARILFCGIQSVWNKTKQLGAVDVLLVDEAHLIPRNAETTYRKFIERLRDDTPDMRIVGLTATAFRLDSGQLHKGNDKVFDDIVYDANVRDLIEQGYLSPLTSKATAQQLDVTGVGKRGGEYIPGQLEIAVDKEWITRSAAEEMARYGANRKAWLAFCAGVKHAEHMRDAIRATGVSCETVTGETPKGDRDRIIGAFRNGQIRCLTSVGVLGTGFNVPAVDMIALLRPTQSAGLFLQQVGRGLRKAEGKQDCVAEGSLVLTDSGLVPIEHITRQMKVWDGCEFVTHSGAVCRGERETISYAGLVATPDHKVWTASGWRPFGECASTRTSISVAEFGGETVRTIEGRFRQYSSEDDKGSRSFVGRMHDLWLPISKRLHEFAKTYCWMPILWTLETGSEVACHAGNCSEAAMHQSKRSSLRTLWCPWDQISFLFSNSDGSLGPRKSRFAQRHGTGPNRQQSTLRAGELALFDESTEPVEHSQETSKFSDACLSIEASRNPLCGRHIVLPDRERNKRPGHYQAISSEVVKTKRCVWDILNAGPRHRFTAEGLLVSNCLVLDFASLTKTHGPIDQITSSGSSAEADKEPGEPLAKECPNCATLVALAARQCPTCDFLWPEREKRPKHEATADASTSILSSGAPAWIAVDAVRYYRHEKMGSPPSLRVEYECGLAVHKSWTCLEHTGFARQKAETWWIRNAGTSPPGSVEEALQRVNELRAPVGIMIRPNGRFFEVAGVRFKKEDAMA